MPSAGSQLWWRGFSVIRLNLRDHGDTEHLNEDLYHAARLLEVRDAVEQLERKHATGPTGLAGFSLGGNFVLRVSCENNMPAVAICPALNPAATIKRIDRGWIGYRLFFVTRFQETLRRKARAFPGRFEIEQALALRSMAELTDLFVADHTGFRTTDDYLAAYTLTGKALSGSNATVVYAKDDPVIPSSDFTMLPATLDVRATAYGGHCGFVYSPRGPSWIDQFLSDHFSRKLASQ